MLACAAAFFSLDRSGMVLQAPVNGIGWFAASLFILPVVRSASQRGETPDASNTQHPPVPKIGQSGAPAKDKIVEPSNTQIGKANQDSRSHRLRGHFQIAVGAQKKENRIG